MPETLQNAKSLASRNLCNLSKDGGLAQLHHANMHEDNAANHLRAWREAARLTQEQLAEKIGTTGAVISLLESGARQLSPKWLRRLAPALGTTPGYLLDHHPDDVPDTLIGAVMEVAPEHRAQVITILQTFRRKTGTDDA